LDEVSRWTWSAVRPRARSCGGIAPASNSHANVVPPAVHYGLIAEGTWEWNNANWVALPSVPGHACNTNETCRSAHATDHHNQPRVLQHAGKALFLGGEGSASDRPTYRTFSSDEWTGQGRPGNALPFWQRGRGLPFQGGGRPWAARCWAGPAAAVTRPWTGRRGQTKTSKRRMGQGKGVSG
jgi:hypothetical protein